MACARRSTVAVSAWALANRSDAWARATCKVRSAAWVAVWVSWAASVRALATFCSAVWLAVSTALNALTASRGNDACTSTRTTSIPRPAPPVFRAASPWLMPCTRSPRSRSRRSAAWLLAPTIDLQKMNWKFKAGFHEHTGISLQAHLPNHPPGGYTRVHQNTAQSCDRQRPPQASSARLSARRCALGAAHHCLARSACGAGAYGGIVCALGPQPVLSLYLAEGLAAARDGQLGL